MASLAYDFLSTNYDEALMSYFANLPLYKLLFSLEIAIRFLWKQQHSRDPVLYESAPSLYFVLTWVSTA